MTDTATSTGTERTGRRWDVDLSTTKPGTPGGIFMRQFWHAIGRSEDLPAGKAKPIRIMSEDYTLYRGTDGVAQVTAYRCPHRGAQMFLGWVEEDSIRCVYHGWKFKRDGRCVEMPAEEPGYEAKVRIPAYPTQEAFGLIYAYFGEGEAPAFPPYPAPTGEGLIDPWPVEHVPCNYLQCFENSMDEVHVAFTHSPGGSHSILAQDLPIISAEEKPWGMLRFGKRKTGKVRHTLHYAPNIVRVIVPPLAGMDGIGGWPEITFHFTPVDDENCLWVITSRVYVSESETETFREKRKAFYERRAAAPPVDQVVREIWNGEHVFADVRHPELAIMQDIAVQAGQGRIADRESEFLGRSDNGILLWRRILARELRAIAAGEPHKTWERPPEDVVPILGV